MIEHDWLNEGVDPTENDPDPYEALISWLALNAAPALFDAARAALTEDESPLNAALHDLILAYEQAVDGAHEYISDAALDLANDPPF